MTQIFKGKCITNRHKIFACVYDVDFLEEWKEGGIFFKTPCSSPRAWLSVTLVCYIVHSDLFSRDPFGYCWGKFKNSFVTHMVLRTWECINPIPTGCCHVKLIYGLIPPMAGRNMVKKDSITQNCWKSFENGNGFLFQYFFYFSFFAFLLKKQPKSTYLQNEILEYRTLCRSSI